MMAIEKKVRFISNPSVDYSPEPEIKKTASELQAAFKSGLEPLLMLSARAQCEM
jgi:hypothetical protein